MVANGFMEDQALQAMNFLFHLHNLWIHNVHKRLARYSFRIQAFSALLGSMTAPVSLIHDPHKQAEESMPLSSRQDRKFLTTCLRRRIFCLSVIEDILVVFQITRE
jgi:hypothetical protein